MLQSSKSLACSFWLLLFGLHSVSAALLVVPQELPSVLSLVYSNIPPVRKGTDSRFGFGFRLGEHADFQILVELGPQKETQPIGNEDSDNSLSKRQLSKQEQRKALFQQQRQKWHEMTSTERIPSSWLESWSKDMKTNNNNNKKLTKKQKQTQAQNDKIALLPTMPVMPELALKQLQLLHKMATTTTATTTSSSTTTTPKPFTGGSLNLGGPTGFTLRPIEVTQPSQILEMINPRKTKSEITAELMDVSLENDGA